MFLSAELLSKEAAQVCIPAYSVWVSPPLGILARPGCGRRVLFRPSWWSCALLSHSALCSVTANDVENLFMCLFVLAHFVMLSFESSLYTLDASPFSCTWFVNSFSTHDDNSEACLWPDLIKNSLYRELRRSVCSYSVTLGYEFRERFALYHFNYPHGHAVGEIGFSLY